MPKISIKIGSLQLLAETTDENPTTVKAILEKLPVCGKAQRWGEEIYFFVPFSIPKEKQRQECNVGELAYWPEGPAIAIFFGKTPASTNDKPRAYSPCNFFACLVGEWDKEKEKLDAVQSGMEVVIDRAK